VQRLEEEKRELVAELEGVKGYGENLEGQLGQYSEEADYLRQQVEVLSHKNFEIQRVVEESRCEIASLKHKESELTAAKGQLADFTDRVERVEREKSNLQESVLKQEYELERSQQKENEMKEYAWKLENEIQMIRVEEQKDLQNMENKMSEVFREISNLKSENHQLKVEGSDMKASVSHLQQTKSELTNQNAVLKEKTKMLKGQLSSHEEKLKQILFEKQLELEGQVKQEERERVDYQRKMRTIEDIQSIIKDHRLTMQK